MLKPGIKELLKEIMLDDIEAVYISITNKAVEWAVAGFIEEANNLLENLWNFNLTHSPNLWLNDEALQILWEITGLKPMQPPFSFKKIESIESENYHRLFHPIWSHSYLDTFISGSINQLHGGQLFAKAVISAYKKTEDPGSVLAAFERYFHSPEAVGYSYFHVTSCATLLAAQNGLMAESERWMKRWGEGYALYWANYSLSYLMRDRSTALLLSKGTLAPIFNITLDLCSKETEEILNMLSRRMSEGRALIYGHLSWSELLSQISKFAFEQKPIRFSEEILQRKSLSRPPALEEDIIATEQKLNLSLPEDYKSFLFTSNGFECFSHTGVTVSSVDKVDFLVNFDEELVDVWADQMEDIDPEFSQKLRSRIIIGGHEEEQRLLLIPLQNNQWECWHFSSWSPGEDAYPGFRFYMEKELQRFEDGFYLD